MKADCGPGTLRGHAPRQAVRWWFFRSGIPTSQPYSCPERRAARHAGRSRDGRRRGAPAGEVRRARGRARGAAAQASRGLCAYRSTARHVQCLRDNRGGNPKVTACTTDFQNGDLMATGEHRPPGVSLVAGTRIRADRHAAARSQLAAGRLVRTGAARAPPMARQVTARVCTPGDRDDPYTSAGPVGCVHRPGLPRKSPPPKPSKEEIMETPHCTSATAVLGMPPSRPAWHSDMEPGP